MADRPQRDLDWVPDDVTGIEVPTTPTQNAGWLVEIPPRQFFNFLWNRCSRWFHYLSGQSQEFIVIDSANANEKDYDTLAAYIADAPAVGDKVLIKETQVLTAQMIIPAGITLRVLDGVEITRATDEVNSVIKFGSDIIIEGVLNLVLSHTGTTAKAIEFDGDNVVGKINVENSSTGILTTVYHTNVGKTGNRIGGFVQNTGAGTIVGILINNSAEISNYYNIVDDNNGSITTYTGIIEAVGGVRTDNVTEKTRELAIGSWDMNTLSTIQVAHGLGADFTKIKSYNVMIRDDANSVVRPLDNFNSSSTGTMDGGVGVAGSTNVSLFRLTGGIFDGTTFDLEEYNLDNAAAVDKGSGLVGIPITAHTFIEEDVTTFAGTTNYDGTHEIVSQTANEIVIAASFVSETFAGTETASWSRGWITINYKA